MNVVKVTINELGPIKNQEVTLSPIMIFTGNSNVGKSYVNYLMYYFFSAFTEGNLRALIEPKIKEDTKGNFSFTLSIEEIRLWLNLRAQDFMRMFLGDNNLICDANFELQVDSFDNIKIVSKKNDVPKELANPFSNMSIRTIELNGNIIYTSFNSDDFLSNLVISIASFLISNLFNANFVKSVILPPARGAYVGETYSTKNSIATSTGMFKLFLRDYDLAVSPGSSTEDKDDRQFFESQVKKLVNGKLISEKDNQFLQLTNGNRIPMTAAASSIKELSPLLFYLMNWSKLQLSICLEEPEAHLHPDMQVNVANLLAAVKNRGSFIQLTTHSDYFLQRVNQLIKLGEIRKKDKDTFKKICSEKKMNNRFYLDKEDVKAYYFETGEDGFTKIKDLTIDENGIPFTTFFNTVQRLNEEEEYLDNIINKYNDYTE